MPIDPRRRDDIVAAVAAYNRAHPSAPLPRNAARLLAVMFATEDVCQRSLEDTGGRGVRPKTLPAVLRRLVEAGFLSQAARARSRVPDTYRLHLPPVQCHEPPPPREGVRPRPRRAAGPQRQGPHRRPTRAPGAPGTASRASTRARSPAPSWTCWRRCCGASTTAASGCCFPSYEAIAAKAECARSTVAEALKALEWAGVLTWQNRITRIRVRERDLFGHWASRWRVIRTSQRLRVPRPAAAARRRSGFQVRKSDGNTESRSS